MWLAAMQAITIETAITGAPPPPPPEYAWMLRTWLQCPECVRAAAECHAQYRELLDAAASVGVEDIAEAIRDHLAEDGYTLDHLATASRRARRRRAQAADGGTDPVQEEIIRILATLGLTLNDVKLSVNDDTTTVQIAESMATLAAVQEAVSRLLDGIRAAEGSEAVELSQPVRESVVIVSAPSPPPPLPPPPTSPEPSPPPPPSPKQPEPAPPPSAPPALPQPPQMPPPLPPTAPGPLEPPPAQLPPIPCSNPCRTSADGIQLTCLHWNNLWLKVASIHGDGSAPSTHPPSLGTGRANVSKASPEAAQVSKGTWQLASA